MNRCRSTLNMPNRCRRHSLVSALALSVLLGLSGCASPLKTGETSDPAPTSQAQAPTLTTLYDSILIDTHRKTPISLPDLVKALKDSDVIFIGEFHGNHASHFLQAQLQARLFQQNPKQILSMEQFERDQQTILNRYLDNEIGEAHLINEAPAWENYAASYRPLVEFAKQHWLPVVAANAPVSIVRCIGRQGEAYLAKLDATERRSIADRPFADIPGYQETYQAWLSGARHLSGNRMHNSFLAQLSRDNTMAESIARALADHPDHQVIHLNGAFHSDYGLGTVAALKRLRPDLNITVISPIAVDNPQQPNYPQIELNKGDYLYLIQPQPEKYRSVPYRQKVMTRLFKQAKEKPCKE
ncbi:ChaN family lipoprotein [Thiomicrorhabdus sp. zzn3]|uniref:ChaN family lipoprotein n=1 Tax=Thiomicrorhabdus sp. zzn3 TaxID=3039775 RepID=UPI002437179C|nr:ChaN family lipoprotein [Thiomicrorhabdus sp. zzn3]MDG6778605.1 ChaN family lipoprotein [Thiomicrorhabdus sp. zzn3]